MMQRRRSLRWLLGGTLAAAISPWLVVSAQSPAPNDAIRKVEAHIEPSTVRRGQVVAWKLMLELAPGWHTYPTRQPDEQAASYVNKFRFPSDAPVVFVGELDEPKTEEKTEDGVRIHSIAGHATWTRPVIVRPDAKPGRVKVPVRVTILACAERCLPPKTILTEAELTISDLPPVPVDPKYREALTPPAR